MTTYLEAELDQMLDEVAILTEGWDEALNMVSKAEAKGDKQMLFDFLREFVPRLHQMQRRFNRVKMVKEGYVISNYSYDMYRWARKKGIETITPNTIVIAPLDLTPEERDQFNAKLDK